MSHSGPKSRHADSHDHLVLVPYQMPDRTGQYLTALQNESGYRTHHRIIHTTSCVVRQSGIARTTIVSDSHRPEPRKFTVSKRRTTDTEFTLCADIDIESVPLRVYRLHVADRTECKPPLPHRMDPDDASFVSPLTPSNPPGRGET